MKPSRTARHLGTKIAIAAVLAAGGWTMAFADDNLILAAGDVAIEQTHDGGYVLSVRAKPGIGSVLLVESTEDPERRVSSYALQNPEYNPLNGDERRRLNGEFLEPSGDRYFIVSSTIQETPDGPFDRAFQLFVPYVVNYGYPWTRNGEIQVLDGTFLNIRTFPLPYSDYDAGFRDNPFVLRVTQPVMTEPDLAEFLDDTVDAFADLAEETTATVQFIADPEDLVATVVRTIDISGTDLDMVLVIDTTGSMTESLVQLREELVEMIAPILAGFERYRIGVTVFRDYLEEYLTQRFPFADTEAGVQAVLNRLRAVGGRDIPEAVYEGLYDALANYPWEAEQRLIVLIGDAPPHPRARGQITADMVFDLARRSNVLIHTIALPHP